MRANIRSSPALELVVLVEGTSDRTALETLAARRGLEPRRAGGLIVEIGGAMNIGHFLDALEEAEVPCMVTGLCDEAELAPYRKAFGHAARRAASNGGHLTLFEIETCRPDLEEELIRAVGTPRVLDLIEANGDLAGFELFSNQPSQRDRSIDARLHRFLGTKSGRKDRYAALLSEAVEQRRVPRPLRSLVDRLEALTGASSS